jgi:hypothetical protein
VHRVTGINVEPVQKLAVTLDFLKAGFYCRAQFQKNQQIVNLLEFQISGYDEGFQVLLGSLMEMETDLSAKGGIFQH